VEAHGVRLNTTATATDYPLELQAGETATVRIEKITEAREDMGGVVEFVGRYPCRHTHSHFNRELLSHATRFTRRSPINRCLDPARAGLRAAVLHPAAPAIHAKTPKRLIECIGDSIMCGAHTERGAPFPNGCDDEYRGNRESSHLRCVLI
jgi:hypothetical protein